MRRPMRRKLPPVNKGASASRAGTAGGTRVEAAFFERRALLVAPDLIGCVLTFDGCGGTIVETEAYEPDDPASHAFRGPTPRNRSMFGPSCHAYVYRSYGLHWCLNFVCLRGSAVLLRAIVPEVGLDLMQRRRGMNDLRRLCAGPGRVCQALGVDIMQDGAPLDRPPFHLARPSEPVDVAAARRIGITQAAERPWRFLLANSPFVSRPVPRAPRPSA
jgi:DNA-3-methyladenine glycosylase